MDDKIVEAVEEVGFVKRHAKGFKRGLIAVGGLVGLGIIGAIINNKRNAEEDCAWNTEIGCEQKEADCSTNSEE